jgi:ribosome-associated translation inhibitor RaiA
MRITLSDGNTQITDGRRAYAEYRFFRVMARHEGLVRAVKVTVRRDAAVSRPFLCAITVDLASSATVRTQARAPHPTAAIDRAAERTAWLLARRTKSATS